MSDFASQQGLQILMTAAIAVFAGFSIVQWLILRRRNARFAIALDNMAQGLCLWSSSAKLILCNRRYVEMYDLSADLARPGASLKEMLQHRIDAGTFAGDPDKYIADLLDSVSKGKAITSVREHKGRHIVIVNTPLEGGGWVATHEDITERRAADRQRIAMKDQEARRATVEAALASFRERVEGVLARRHERRQRHARHRQRAVRLVRPDLAAHLGRGRRVERSIRQRRDRRRRGRRIVELDR